MEPTTAPEMVKTPRPKRPSLLLGLWELLVSPAAFVFVSCLWCLDLAIGSVVAYNRDPKFWMKMDALPFNLWFEKAAPRELPYTAWVYILVGLTWVVAVSLLLCTIQWFFRRRAKKRGMAEVSVHFGFLLVFAGFVFGSGWGERVQNVLVAEGETVQIRQMSVGLRLTGVETVRNEAGQELDTVSRVALMGPDGAVLAEGTARLNHPLIHGETVVYPNGGGRRISGVNVIAGRLGPVEIGEGFPAPLPDGRFIVFRGGLAEGERSDAFVGPGAYLVLADRTGFESAGAFVGEDPLFRTARLGNMELSWVGSKTRTEASFNVHRDPGIQLVLFGAVILTLGTLWALVGYFRRTT